MPEFQTLEEVVGNWNEIPVSAFPRPITLGKPVEFILQGGVGKSKQPAGAKVVALSIDGSQLTVAPYKGATVSGVANIDDTNFKQALGAIYENYKNRRKREVLAKREAQRRKDMEPELAARSTESAQQRLLGDKPEQNRKGMVAVAAASIKNKDITEFGLKDIKSWSPVVYDEIEGEPYWVCIVSYKAKTVFGDFPAEAMALIRRGKVEKWIYAGSHEPIP